MSVEQPDLRSASKTGSFLSLVAAYTEHLRAVQVPDDAEEKEEERCAAVRFVEIVSNAHVWPLVQQLAPEYRYPM